MWKLRVVLAVAATLLLVLPVGAAAHGTSVTGTVVTESGDAPSEAYVLVQPAAAQHLERATNGSDPIARALLDLAADPPLSMRVNTTTSTGEYVVHLDSPGDYEVIAVTEDGRVSRLRTVRVAYEAATLDLRLDPDRVQTVEAGNAAGTPGRTTTVAIRVPNTDDDPLRNLSVGLGELPAGWTVEAVESDGTYDEAAGTVRWDQVAPGTTATATVRLSVPEDAELRTYAIEVTGRSDSHFLQHVGAARVRVSPANSSATPPPTPTPLGGDSITLPDRTAAPARPAGGPPVPLLSVAVFSTGVAVAAYALGRTGLPFVGQG